MSYVLCSTLIVAWLAFLVNAQLRAGSPCDVGDHENNNGSYRASSTDCSKYLQCEHGVYIERTCSPGTHWNIEEGACDWPQKAKCENLDTEQRNEVGGPCNVGDHEDNTGLYIEHPRECGKYLQCLHGSFGERSCPEGLHWSVKDVACQWPQKANCRYNVNAQPDFPRPPVQYV